MKLFIFDFDGPINNLTESKKAALQKISQKLKLEMPPLTQWHFINYIDQIYEAEKEFDYQRLVSKVLRKLVRENLLQISDTTIEDFARIFSELLSKNMIIHPNLEQIIAGYKKNGDVQCCIYTNQKREYIINLLKENHIDETIFEAIYGREMFDEVKPSMKNLMQIANDFRAEYQDVTVFGDRVVLDLEPAAYLGMRTVLVNRFVSTAVFSLEDFTEDSQ